MNGHFYAMIECCCCGYSVENVVCFTYKGKNWQ